MRQISKKDWKNEKQKIFTQQIALEEHPNHKDDHYDEDESRVEVGHVERCSKAPDKCVRADDRAG